VSDVFELFMEPDIPVGLSRQVVQALDDLERTVEALGSLNRQPDLSMVAKAVQDLLEATGRPLGEAAASRWAYYETEGRAKTQWAEAWARCNALFKLDLEAMESGWAELPTPDEPHPSLPLQAQEPDAPPDR